MSFDLDAYNTVPERITEFRAKHPGGSLQQVAIDFREVAGSWWVIYTAAAHRDAWDDKPGMGTAWEPIPGKTNFTRDSEVQNAETAAWGRAIVAALAADTRKGVASAEEVQARRGEQIGPDPSSLRAEIARIAKMIGWDLARVGEDFAEWSRGAFIADSQDVAQLTAYRDFIDENRKRYLREHRQLAADVNQTTQAGHTRKDSTDRGRVARSAAVPATDEFYTEPVAP